MEPLDYVEDNENYNHENAMIEDKNQPIDPLAPLQDVKPYVKSLVEYSYKQKKRERKQKFNSLNDDKIKEEDNVIGSLKKSESKLYSCDICGKLLNRKETVDTRFSSGLYMRLRQYILYVTKLVRIAI